VLTPASHAIVSASTVAIIEPSIAKAEVSTSHAVSTAETELAVSTGEAELVGIALTFQGRQKRVRHHRDTLVGGVAALHPSIPQDKPLVVLDKHGYEVGSELSLGTLRSQEDANGGSNRILELKLEYDEW